MADYNFWKFGMNMQPSAADREYIQISEKFSGHIELTKAENVLTDDSNGFEAANDLDKSDGLADSDNELYDGILCIRDATDQEFDLIKVINGQGTLKKLNDSLLRYEYSEDQRSVKPEGTELTPVQESEEDCSKTLKECLEKQSFVDLKTKAVSLDINSAENQDDSLKQLKSTGKRLKSNHSSKSSTGKGSASLVQNTVSVHENETLLVNNHDLIGTSSASIPQTIALTTLHNSLVGKSFNPIPGNASFNMSNVSVSVDNGPSDDPKVTQNPSTLTPPEPPDNTHYTISDALKVALSMKLSLQKDDAPQVSKQPNGQAAKNLIAQTSGRYHPYKCHYQESLPNLPEFE